MRGGRCFRGRDGETPRLPPFSHELCASVSILRQRVLQCRGDAKESLAGGTVRGEIDKWGSGVGTGAHLIVQRYLAKEWKVEMPRYLFATPRTEDGGGMIAGGAPEIAHVLDEAEHGDLALPEHLDTPPNVRQSDFRRGGDDDGAAERS